MNSDPASTSNSNNSSTSSSWYAEIGRYLQSAGAPRILTLTSLCKLIDGFKPNFLPSLMPTALHELFHNGLLKAVTYDLSLNLCASPAVDYRELAYWLRPHSVVSLSTVVGGTPLTSSSSPATVQSVIPTHGKRERYSEVLACDGVCFEFYTLPETFFPPYLPDYGDCLDATKGYPCATREKAYLDLLYITKLVGYPSLHVPPIDATFRRAELFSLAGRMNLQELLYRQLDKFPVLKKQDVSTSNYGRKAEMGPEDKTRMLKTIADVWLKNPHLSFSEILITVKPDDSSLDLNEVSDLEWQAGVQAYRKIA
jgi:hypothetical protein